MSKVMCKVGVNSTCNLKGVNWALFTLLGYAITLPLCLFKKFKSFSYVNLLALSFGLAFWFYVFITLFTSENYYNTHPSPNKNAISNLISDIPIFSLSHGLKYFGMSAFAVEFVPPMFAMRHTMKRPQKFGLYISRVMVINILFAVILAISIALVNPI